MAGLDELLAAWRRDPSAERAVALCEELAGAAERARLGRLASAGGHAAQASSAGSPAAYVPIVIAAAREVGTQHGQHPAVLIGIARMYLATGELTVEAQSVLVRAARLSADDPRTFRLLGDALLLRGDAQRAVMALERAVAGGIRDDVTRALHARACSLAVVQTARGEAEVALEVRRDFGFAEPPGESGATMRATDLLPSEDDELTRVKTSVRAGLRGALDSEPDPTTESKQPAWHADEVDEAAGTLVTSMEEILAAVRASSSNVRSALPRPLVGRHDRDSDPTIMREVPIVVDQETTNTITLPVAGRRVQELPASVLVDDEDTHMEEMPSALRQEIARVADAADRARAAVRDDPTPATEVLDRPAPPRPVLLASRLADVSRRLPAITGDSDSEIRVDPNPALREMPTRPEAGVEIAATGPPMRPDELVDEYSKSEVKVGVLPLDPTLAKTEPFPPREAAAVRRALDLPSARAASPPFEIPEAPAPRRSWARWLVALVLLGAAGGGGWLELERRRVESARETVELVERAERQMRSGSMRELSLALGDAKRALSLSEDNRRAALAVVNASAIAALEDNPARAAELAKAIEHARSLGASDSELAAAALAGAVARGDRAAARELIARNAAADRRPDALFELAAGAALEAEGDPAHVARYEAAVRADPSLGSAHVRVARAHLLSRQPDKAAPALQAIAERAGDKPEARVLAALEAFLSPASASKPLGDLEAADVVRPLRSIAWVLRARERPDSVGASSGLAAAVDDADVGPVMVFCGGVALALGDVESAQRAAGRAVTLSPRWEAARALEAEVALARGKLEEARSALASTGVGGARARLLLAYEDGDAAAIAAAASGAPDVAAVVRARLEGRAVDDATKRVLAGPAADLFECDAALDRGDLAAARAVVARWPDARTHPLRVVRWARLQRYEGRTPPPETLAAFAPTRAADIEKLLVRAESHDDRTAALTALGDPTDPDKKWLAGYLRARHGAMSAARRQLARLRPPLPDAPLRSRIAAAVALAEVQDRPRGEPVVKALLASVPDNPDVSRAGAKLGLRKK